MSWSVNAVGKAPAVARAIEEQFDRQGKCAEPEETVRISARAVIAAALKAQGDNVIVKVAASGSQGMYNWNKEPKENSNQLSISIDPIYGFCE